jgi:1,4-dihydroxy-2-naphthoate octaprenyltransferase
MLAWFLAARPITLTATLVPIALAHLLIQREHNAVNMLWSVLAFLSAACIQVGTNYYNDVIDFESGVDSDKRAGPRRLIQNGVATIEQVRFAAHTAFVVAMLVGGMLVAHAGWPILLLGITSIIFGYGYSAPPLKLSYRGLSEIFVILFFGVGAVCGVEWIHRGSVSLNALYLGITVGLLSTNLLIVNNIRDIEGDRLVGKLTLPARYGLRFGIAEFVACSLLAVFFSMLFWARLSVWGGMATSAFLPLFLCYRLLRSSPQSSIILPLAALSHLLFGIITGIIIIYV